MAKMLFCVAETYKRVLRDANHFQNSPVMTHPVMYTKLSLKKKQLASLQILSQQSSTYCYFLYKVFQTHRNQVFWYANFGEENMQIHSSGLSYTKSFYSTSQSAPRWRWPLIKFPAEQKSFVAPCRSLASCADQLVCQNEKNKSFRMSLDECNKKNHILKNKEIK